MVGVGLRDAVLRGDGREARGVDLAQDDLDVREAGQARQVRARGDPPGTDDPDPQSLHGPLPSSARIGGRNSVGAA